MSTKKKPTNEQISFVRISFPLHSLENPEYIYHHYELAYLDHTADVQHKKWQENLINLNKIWIYVLTNMVVGWIKIRNYMARYIVCRAIYKFRVT